MMQWTDSQTKVINDQSQFSFIEAGAGSGKTAVLTQKIINTIQAGIPQQKILAITFTEKAATSPASSAVLLDYHQHCSRRS